MLASSSCSARAIASSTGRDPGEGAAFQVRVALHAHPGQSGNLAARQSGDPALAGDGQAGPVGSDLGATTEPRLCPAVRIARAVSLAGPAGQDRRNIRKLVASDG